MLIRSMSSSSFQQEMTALFLQGRVALATSVTSLLDQSRIYETPLKVRLQSLWRALAEFSISNANE